MKLLTYIKIMPVFLQIDILLNNAGRGMRGKWWEVNLEVDRDIWQLNVLGTVSLTRNVLSHMMKRGQGQVALISSIVGKICMYTQKHCNSKWDKTCVSNHRSP